MSFMLRKGSYELKQVECVDKKNLNYYRGYKKSV